MSYLRKEPLDETNYPPFADIKSRFGFVPNFYVAQTMRPDLIESETGLVNTILIEEGARDFEVRASAFRRIRGNALWTHSLYTSPRSEDGRLLENHFDSIGRDAIQVGHATRVRVEGNTGVRIGFPSEIVDAEHAGTPVGIDTAGNVDHTEYVRNRFEEINGKCIDLDGFHDGVVRENICINKPRCLRSS